jgi:DNA-binding NarL/FixJ family response regulator
MNVLLVDDHELIREALRAVIQEVAPSAEVSEAGDCRQALAHVSKSHSVELLLLDLNLPDGNGLELLGRLRASNAETSIVILSAISDREHVLRALDLGAVGFIPKSASRQVMVNALRLVLAGGTYIPPEALGASGASPPSRPQAAQPAPSDLGITERQLDVLALMMQGKSNKWICRALDLAEPTVKHHVTAVLKALGVSNRTEAVLAVTAMGWQLSKVG